MKLVWSTTNKPVSRLIRWGLSEDVSHFVNVFYESEDSGLVLQQQIIGGFDIDWLPYFADKNKIIYVLEPKSLTDKAETNLMKDIMTQFSGTNYDDGSLLYFAYRAFLLKVFKIPLPKRGKWGDMSDPLCTGHARVLQKHKPEWFSRPVKDFDILTPGELYKNLLDSGEFNTRSTSLVSW